MKYFIISLLAFSATLAFGQSQTKRVLFIGNSYTYVNDLPKMIADMAAATGDTLIYDRSTPGGFTLQGHSTNATTISKIKAGNWDYVVLQEQSQRPSFPISQVQTSVFPYARLLDSLINHHDSCAETVFYMTWGRKNGDASNCAFFPPLCTYQGMDSLLNLRYRMMADSNDAIVSPVGAVWNYIRANHPNIELYSSDKSHPSVAGTYAAACSFYSTFFRKDPSLVPFNSSLIPIEAISIRSAAKVVAFDSLPKWHVGEYDPVADFDFMRGTPCSVHFTNHSKNADTYYWDFGDGTSSSLENPSHTYQMGGSVSVRLTASKCGKSNDTVRVLFDPCNIGLVEFYNQNLSWSIFPNPVNTALHINKLSKSNYSFLIKNSIGVEMIQGNLEEESQSLDVTSLPTGIYFLHLTEKGKSLGYRKFVKN